MPGPRANFATAARLNTAPGQSANFLSYTDCALPPGSDLVTAAGSPAALQGTYGSVVVTSDRPVVAIVNESSYALDGRAGNQDSKNYEGFNIQ